MNRSIFPARRIFLTILAALTFGIAVIAHPPGRAYACSCIQPGPPAEAAAQSQAVFSGTVDNIAPQANGNLVTFNVDTIWKGPNGPQLTLATAGSSASCGYDFVAGEKYIVYAFAQDGQLATGLCSRTATFDNAAADLAELGDGQTPEPAPAQPASEPAPAQPAAGLPLLPIGLGVLGVAAVAAVAVAFSRRRA